MTYRWTIRNVDPEVVDLIAEVSETSGLTFGELVSQGLLEWHAQLPFEDEEDPEESGDPVTLEG